MIYQSEEEEIISSIQSSWRWSIVENEGKHFFNVRKWSWNRFQEQFVPTKIGCFVEIDLMLPVFKKIIAKYDHSSNQSQEIPFVDK